jgi:glycosyltransferase involved in cell wall biosynthesis
MILTIGIPVLNGSAHILNTLKSILSESSLIDEQIELLIVDNKSVDGTQKILSDFFNSYSEHPNIRMRFKYNDENLGLDNSIYYLIASSTGEFTWLLGAQEVLHFGSLRTIVNQLKKKPWQVVLNSTMWDEASNREIQNNLYGRYSDLVFDNPSDFYATLGGPCLSLSANVSRSEPLRMSLKADTKTRYWGWLEYWMDASVAEERDGNFVFISKPMIQILVEAKGWQATGTDTSGSKSISNAQTVYYTFVELTEIARDKFDTQLKIRDSLGAYRDHFGVPRAIAMAKATGLRANPTVIFRSIRAFGFTPWFWTLGLPILLTPRFLLNNKIISFFRKVIHFFRMVLRAPAK